MNKRKQVSNNPAGYECTILGADNIQIGFIVDGTYHECYDKETGCIYCDFEVTEIWLVVEEDKYILLPLEIIDDTVREELESQFIEKYKSSKPTKQDIKDMKGDERYHELKEEGKI